jgi:hypothetical protein
VDPVEVLDVLFAPADLVGNKALPPVVSGGGCEGHVTELVKEFGWVVKVSESLGITQHEEGFEVDIEPPGSVGLVRVVEGLEVAGEEVSGADIGNGHELTFLEVGEAVEASVGGLAWEFGGWCPTGAPGVVSGGIKDSVVAGLVVGRMRVCVVRIRGV